MSRSARRLSDRDLREIAVLRGYGLTEAAIAHVKGLSPRTFRRRKRDDRVLAALEKGKAEAEAKVGRALFKRAIQGDVGAIVWYEKTRCGRTDRQVLEHVELDLDHLTPQQMDQIIERATKQGKRLPLTISVVYDDVEPPGRGVADELLEVRTVAARALPAPNGDGAAR